MFDRMKRINARSSDSGLSLVEVLVAMLIFSMLVVGIGYSLIMVLQMTKDSQARETAVSLASSELDAVRAIGDPFKVFSDGPRTQSLGGNKYTISRTAAWVTPDGQVDTCGTGGLPLKYKSVTVTVSWAGMRDGVTPVRTDTALVPSTRINDPNKGTILVSVKDAGGLGKAGVTLTAVNGATSLVTTDTNSDGCSFILGVEPGSYVVTLTNPNFMDIKQRANPTMTLPVTAGASALFPFQFDKRGTYLVNYAANDTTPSRPMLPITSMTTSFFNANGYFTTQVATPGLQGTAYLYAAQAGYTIVAGGFVPSSQTGTSCEAVDPASWADDTTKTPVTKGTRPPIAFAVPGGTSAVTKVPMGVLNVTGTKAKTYLYAVSLSSTFLPGQPVCDVPTTYSFGKVFTQNSVTTQKIALPFGSWKLVVSDGAVGAGTTVILPPTALLTPGQVIGTTGNFVLDPRGVVVP